jgi:hypothetical protein
LINVRFGALYGLKSDISQGPDCAQQRTFVVGAARRREDMFSARLGD